jgi:hypothetical protein
MVKPTHEIGELPAFVGNRTRQIVGEFTRNDGEGSSPVLEEALELCNQTGTNEQRTRTEGA